MSYVETTYCGVKRVEVKDPVTRPHPATGKTFTTQYIKFTMADGSRAWITLHLDNGCNALALGDVTVNESEG